MNYKSFNLGDWIGHISGVIEDETTLDGNEMRDLVEFLSTLKQEPCEDCISRKAAIDAMIKLEQDDIECYGCAIPEGFNSTPAIEALNSLPSITLTKKIGKWVYRTEHFDDESQPRMAYGCSICGRSIKSVHEKGNYCPNCGAKMIEPQKNEDQE